MFESMKRGVDIVEAFSNSPPYYMTCSLCAAGNFDAKLDNLPPDHYDDFVDYLTEVVKYYRVRLNLYYLQKSYSVCICMYIKNTLHRYISVCKVCVPAYWYVLR